MDRGQDEKSLDDVFRPHVEGILGWTLEDAKWYSDHLCLLRFSREGREFHVFIANRDADSDAFIETTLFKLGYNEEYPDPEGLDLVRAIAQRLETLDSYTSDEVVSFLGKGAPKRNIVHQEVHEGVVEGFRDTVLRVTTHCNERCPFCFVNPKDPALDEASALKVIEKIAEKGGKKVTFGGGEPTLAPYLPALVRYAKGRGLYVIVQSNGLFGPDFWDRFDVLPDSVLFSLHTQFPERLEMLTGRAGTMEKKLAAIRQTLSKGICVNLNFVISNLNIDEVPLFPSFVSRTFRPWKVGVVFSVVEPCQRVKESPEIIPTFSELSRALTMALRSGIEEEICCLVPDTCGVPPCLAPDYYWLFLTAAKRIEVTESAMKGRVKSPGCCSCIFDRWCLGVWEEFMDMRDYEAIRPITATRPLTLREELVRRLIVGS